MGETGRRRRRNFHLPRSFSAKTPKGDPEKQDQSLAFGCKRRFRKGNPTVKSCCTVVHCTYLKLNAPEQRGGDEKSCTSQARYPWTGPEGKTQMETPTSIQPQVPYIINSVGTSHGEALYKNRWIPQGEIRLQTQNCFLKPMQLPALTQIHQLPKL